MITSQIDQYNYELKHLSLEKLQELQSKLCRMSCHPDSNPYKNHPKYNEITYSECLTAVQIHLEQKRIIQSSQKETIYT